MARAADVPEAVVPMRTAGGELRVRQVTGTRSSLILARRTPGYASEPHRHACEQLNYVLSGRISIYVEDEEFALEAGDFLRIPDNVVHHAKNRSDGDCELLEVHAPALELAGPEALVALLAEDERGRSIPSVPNEWV